MLLYFKIFTKIATFSVFFPFFLNFYIHFFVCLLYVFYIHFLYFLTLDVFIFTYRWLFLFLFWYSTSSSALQTSVEALISLTFGWVLIQLSEHWWDTRSLNQDNFWEQCVSTHMSDFPHCDPESRLLTSDILYILW